MSRARTTKTPKTLFVLFVLSVLAGAALGALAARLLAPQGVTAESRLVVGDQTLSAQAVPGYAEGTKQLAATYSRLVMSDEVRQAVNGTVRSVSATAVADTAIIRIAAVADNEKDALAACREAGKRLVAVSAQARNSQSPTKALASYRAAYTEFQKANKALGDARAEDDQAAIDAAQKKVAETQLTVNSYGQLYQEQLSGANGGSGQVVTVAQPTVVTEQLPRTPLLGALLGAFGATALWGAWLMARRPRGSRSAEPWSDAPRREDRNRSTAGRETVPADSAQAPARSSAPTQSTSPARPPVSDPTQPLDSGRR